MIYRWLGPPFLRMVVALARKRYRRQIRAGVGIAAVAVGVAAYLAGRDVPEG
jgi:hypothetical protein